MEELKNQFSSMKTHVESPMLFLIEHFKDLMCRVDLAAEKHKEKPHQSKNTAQINSSREMMIKKIESYENECYSNLKKSSENSHALQCMNENMKSIESKLNEYDRKKTPKESELTEQLSRHIDQESLKFYSKLFLNKYMLFIQDFENGQCFGKLFMVNNEYVSVKSLDYIHE